MNVNICESLRRRLVENEIQTYRHNQREEEMLEEKFAFYQQQFRSIDNSIHMTEHSFEQRAKDDFSFRISSRQKSLEASNGHRFYYASTNEHWTTIKYVVQPLQSVLQLQDLDGHAFERRSRQYSEELKQNTRIHKLRKVQFMHQILFLIRNNDERTNDRTLQNVFE